MAQMNTERRYYSIEQLSNYFGKSRRWVERRMKDFFLQQGLRPKVIGVTKVYDIEQIEKILKAS